MTAVSQSYPVRRCVSGHVDADVLDRYPQLWLRCLRVNDVPVTAADEFKRFITMWRDVDRNGTWNPDSVVEGDGALVYEDECGKDVWSVVGVTSDGIPLYAIPGWDWVWEDNDNEWKTKEDS